MKCNIIQIRTNTHQNDDSTLYYAIEVDGKILKMSEYQYPGNDKALQFFKEIEQKLIEAKP